ncbi:hypothetical protein [Flagellimonas eckloniae]|uniref:Uncharacterized protein n=1 Tax=Flagellimonas eckloniae TaxID=346185 RepID=A0A0Q1H6P6_9FLAO|nr:hypothetical protein [Allomuricauda eckloniae]KQC29333.1 hypothetical protein AAY42_05005 [Allomuricauda eckloniae]
MKTPPIKRKNLLSVFSLVLLLFSCGKDEDLFYEAVLEEPEIVLEENIDDGFETKTFTFSTINDVFLQKSTVYNQSIVRLEEGNRTGYLMFDLSPIEKVNGEIQKVVLQFTTYGDKGNGNISFLKGLSSNWQENVDEPSALPDMGNQLNSINDSYEIGVTKEVTLDVSTLSNEKITVVVQHNSGNDLAIASKEHTSNKGPKLKVTYRAPEGSEDIVVEDNVNNEESSDNDSEGEGDGENTDQTNEDTNTDEEVDINHEVGADVQHWKDLFDKAWAEQYPKAVAQSESGNAMQEYYYMSYSLDGLIQIWQATGDNKYLDDALDLIENTMDDAIPVSGENSGYLGWPSNLERYGDKRNQEGTNLWESFMYRFVATLLRIMKQSPNLMSQGSYQSRYNNILAFTEEHIWEKWYRFNDNLSGIYRSRSHTASHWARIGMELYIITGESEYLEVFENVSYKGMSRYSGSSLRDRIFNIGSAYAWYETWESDNIQDVNHGSDVVSFWVTAYENGMYWNAEDMRSLVATTNELVWESDSPIKFTVNVDGSGTANNGDAGSHGMIAVGRFDESLQARIHSHYNTSKVNYQESQAMGIAAMNRKLLNDGRGVYPEN